MSLLENWIESPVAEAVGWTLLHSLWEGAVIAAVLGAALLVMRSPRARYATACAAMLAMVAAFGLTLARVMPEVAQSPRARTAPAALLANVQPGLEAAADAGPNLAEVVPWLAPLWIAGVAISCFWYAAGWLSVYRLRRRGVCCAPDVWQQQLAGLRASLQISRPVVLLESCLVDVPMVLGHFRPLILMPIGLLARLPVAQVEAILLHELAHIRRYDYLVNLVQRSVECLLFYHPAAWWMSRVIRAERENCCDDVVVAMNGNAHEYAVALAALEQERWSGREPAVAATGGSLVKRIRRLLYPKAPHGAWTPLLAAVVLIASGALALTAWPAPPQQRSAAQIEADLKASENSKVVSLGPEVTYIISDEERAAFERLDTEEQKRDFIAQFWERRDPTAGTARNEFKDEHYRRVEYSVARFTPPSGKPGWQTDRGRILIVYGPPDEIETHPSGSPSRSYPYETWRYNHVDGIGDNLFITFIDRNKSGDYEIAPDPRGP